jgi:segregation and condensation protein A
MDFRVDLELFRGPLDLLLYLVRKHEVEVLEIALAEVTEQFLAYLDVLDEHDVNAAGDFLEVASTLLEIKSRSVLPRGDEETEEVDEAQQQLVRRLLQYKQFRDAASILEEQGRNWQQHFARLADDDPVAEADPLDRPLRQIQLWDLVTSLGKLLRERTEDQPTSIIYDETPIHVFMLRIHTRLEQERRLSIGSLFESGMLKSTRIGIFLAVLELVRHGHVNTEPQDLHEQLWLQPGPRFHQPLDIVQADNYDPTSPPR